MSGKSSDGFAEYAAKLLNEFEYTEFSTSDVQNSGLNSPDLGQEKGYRGCGCEFGQHLDEDFTKRKREIEQLYLQEQ